MTGLFENMIDELILGSRRFRGFDANLKRGSHFSMKLDLNLAITRRFNWLVKLN